MSEYPKSDSGFFHLTPQGWVRCDHRPFPVDRVETWSYEMECQAEDAKERVCLTRIWANSRITPQDHAVIRSRFGEPLSPTVERNVVLECRV
jgi:hypothetical protein